MQKKILIVCFDTPFPTNYGGVFDIVAKFNFYKKNNIKIDLICTCFDSKRVKEFRKFVSENETVIDNFHIEQVKPSFLDIFLFFSFIPFSVLMRKIDFDKIDFLKSNEYSMVLVEHLKSTYKIHELSNFLKGNPEFYLRIHNDEEDYYKNLYQASKSLKKYFFLLEFLKYRSYQKNILKKSIFKGFLFISKSEMNRLHPYIDNDKLKMLLPIYSENNIDIKNNSKNIDFLYIGNLDLDDNFKSLQRIKSFLIEKNLSLFHILIAGKCTGNKRQNQIKKGFKNLPNVKFQFNLDRKTIDELFHSSKIFLNFSSNKSGVKTKLIDALSFGIPVISNQDGVEGSGFEEIILRDKNLDENWLKNALNDTLVWSEFQLEYNKKIMQKQSENNKIYEDFFSQF